MALWIARRGAGARAQELIARARLPGGARVRHDDEHALRARRGRSAAGCARRADKSISHRAALLGAMASEPVRIERYLHAADTCSTLAAVRVARRARGGARRGGRRARHRPARGARAATGRSTSATRAPCCACCPAGWPAQEGRSFTLDGDDSIRRRPVDRVAEPLRRMGADLSAREGAPAAARARRAAARDRLRAPRGERAGQVVHPARRARRRRQTTVAEPARSRDHTERMLLARGRAISRAGRQVDGRATPTSSRSTASRPRRPELGGVPGRRRRARARLAAAARRRRVNWTRTGFLRIVRRMRGIVLGDLEEGTTSSPRASRSATSTSPTER